NVAWYANLKAPEKALVWAIGVSWLIALGEYVFAVPANRIGSTGEIAAITLFLASSDADFITGQLGFEGAHDPAKLTEHLQAGADHVAIQVLGGPDELLSTLEELAGPLGLAG
ncbi:DMT family protein, partial [Mycolicibacterium poriferae]|uniref:DMT family protein n=1 Tax=Mycolicibacterium poriferae TaxID=39694 RepID=UPI0024B8D886